MNTLVEILFMKYFTYISFIGFFMLLNYSCTFYYKTADIDAKLKKAVVQINSNCSSVQTQNATAQKDFNAMKCNSKEANVQKAKEYLLTMETEMKAINQIKANVTAEYEVFLKYTKGKNQIQSKTEDWKKFKQTKRIMKTSSKDFKRKGNKLTKIAADFSEFTTNEFKSIQFVDVLLYNKKFEELQGDFANQEKELGIKIKNQESQVVDLVSKKSESHAEKCKILQEDLVKISEEKKKITNLKLQISESIKSFKTTTNGIVKIYSCSSDWDMVKKIEENMNQHQLDLQTIVLNLSQIHAHMQEIITSMN
jgi:hypothetical protein